MPRLRLTAQHVETLPAKGGKRTDYSDSICPGLVLRVSPSGVRSWSVLVPRGSGRAGRRVVRVTIGKAGERWSLAAAREEARKILEHGPPTGAGLTVAKLVERALADLDLAPTTRREWKRLAEKEIVPGLGSQPAAELERAEIRAWLREIGLRSKVTSNRAFTVLRRCYSWALAEEVVRTSPLAGLTKLYAERPSARVLTLDELRRMVGALARLREAWPGYSDATLLLLLTMVRESALIGMRRDELRDLDGTEPTWTVPPERSKSGREHVVPLSPAAVRVIERRLAAVDALSGPDDERLEHLFPVGGAAAGEDRAMTWSSNWIAELLAEMRPVVEAPAGGLALGPEDPPWTIHGLRRTAATHLVDDLGVPFHVVSLLLGHAMPGPRVSLIYVRAELLAERRAALARWAEWLERLAEPGARPARILRMRRKSGPR